MGVRIGFIGAGGIAGAHLATLLRLPDAEVVALSDVSSGAMEATRRSVNAGLAESGSERRLDAVGYADYKRMLRAERLDAVYVCVPPFAHGAPENAVIAAGLPMLVEKPVALDLPTAARLLDGIREKGLLVAVGYQFRYTRYLERARELIGDRTVGQVVILRHGDTPPTSWFPRQDRSGGQIIEMATHQVDMARALAGEVRTVSGVGATRVNNVRNPEYDIYDANSLALLFESGAVGSFAGNFLVEFPTHLDAWGIHVYCDGLVLSLGSTLRASTPDGTEETPLDDEPMAAEDRAFVRAVAEGRPELVRSDYENAVRTLAATIAADRAQRTGRTIDIRELLAAEAPNL